MSESSTTENAGAKDGEREWLKLDNAAKIYPSTYSRTQNHLYRISAEMSETVARGTLKAALGAVIPRFPSIAVSLHRGLFWYYFEPIKHVPDIRDDGLWPLMPMSFSDIRRCGFRILVNERTVSMECFHAVTDGGGAYIFFRTLLAEYLRRRYGIEVPCTDGVLDINEKPKKEELEDCFTRFAGPVPNKRDEVKAYRLSGTLVNDGYLTWTALTCDIKDVLAVAKKHGVTLTGLLCAAMMTALIKIQKESGKKKQKPIAVSIPVNLRKLYPSETLRNFSLYATPHIDPLQGEWTFDEICCRVKNQMGERITPKEMAACVAANVRMEQKYAVRLLPLFLKNFVMRLYYYVLGSNACCISLSNLGNISVPEVMRDYITDIYCQMDSHEGSVVSVCLNSYGDKLHIRFCRCIEETKVEYEFYKVLRDIGLNMSVKSNAR
ncbi:MAG: hypothetical protein PHI27_08905 [Eubacteriales bacterium]|nr:hypothetical protein [Eubacteriales bacterium]MDD3882359.1 hypothetical protein [Eubacteriales bacterium]MDD4512420.1 hypothetical protein [Eubacteriales bacterium]